MSITDKSTVLADSKFRRHAQQVSKMALIDLVWDLLVKINGEDVIGDGIQAFDEAFSPVANVREDRMPKSFD